MTSTAADRPTRVSTARAGLVQRVREIWRYRELLVALTKTELKVKYKNSALGFVWSMLNPALYLVVFYVVFQLILGNGIPNFPIFLLSGLLVWNLFSTALAASTSSVVANAGLVRKVAFPREILPLASVGAALLHFFLQAIVLVLALVIFRYDVAFGYLPLLPVALRRAVPVRRGDRGLPRLRATCSSATPRTSSSLRCSRGSGSRRSCTRTPPSADKMGSDSWLYLLNPVTDVVLTFQRAIYAQVAPVTVTNGKRHDVTQILPVGVDQWWYLWHLGLVIVISSVLFLLALAYFGRAEGDFAEEL